MAVELFGAWVHSHPDSAAALQRAAHRGPSPAVRKKGRWYAPGGPVHHRPDPTSGAPASVIPSRPASALKIQICRGPPRAAGWERSAMRATTRARVPRAARTVARPAAESRLPRAARQSRAARAHRGR
jgi:hypothetical protein